MGFCTKLFCMIENFSSNVIENDSKKWLGEGFCAVDGGLSFHAHISLRCLHPVLVADGDVRHVVLFLVQCVHLKNNHH